MTDHRRKLRDSRLQEKELAEDLQGQPQAGSGTSWRARGDTRTFELFRGEAKTTTGKGIRVTEEQLLMLEKQAGGFEIPIFQIQFQRMSGNRKYGIIPWHSLMMLLEEAGIIEEDE